MKSRKFTYLILPLCLCLPFLAFSQEEWQQEGHIINVHISYGAQFPGGDLKERFGNSFQAMGAVEWQTDQTDWLFGLEGGIIFGNDVKEDVLAGLRNESGYIIGINNNIADVVLRQRGLYAGAYVGKIIHFQPKLRRSGLKLAIGPGLLQHKFRIQDNSQSTPNLDGEYAKGYDHLSNGFALRQFIGFQHLSYSRTINFSIGFEFTQAWTKNRRTVNFDTMSANNEQRFDLLFGIRASWILPFYIGQNPETIYY